MRNAPGRHSFTFLLPLILPYYNDSTTHGFVHPLVNTFINPKLSGTGCPLFAKGFGSSPEKKGSGKGFKNKTYGSAARPSRSIDIIDTEEAMSSFFSTNDEWSSLFRSFISSPSAPARSFLANNHNNNHGETTEFGLPFQFEENDGNVPWKQLSATPSTEDELSVLASFLDTMQQSLVEIPVDETTKDDASDLHFIEEGRRILVVSRFHVLTAKDRPRVEQNEELFMTCWSEMAELKRAGQSDTGSLILLPDYDLADLKRFTEMNLQQPLQWMGINRDTFEVASLERGSAAIRILHKLSDIPNVEPKVERMS